MSQVWTVNLCVKCYHMLAVFSFLSLSPTRAICSFLSPPSYGTIRSVLLKWDTHKRVARHEERKEHWQSPKLLSLSHPCEFKWLNANQGEVARITQELEREREREREQQKVLASTHAQNVQDNLFFVTPFLFWLFMLAPVTTLLPTAFTMSDFQLSLSLSLSLSVTHFIFCPSFWPHSCNVLRVLTHFTPDKCVARHETISLLLSSL